MGKEKTQIHSKIGGQAVIEGVMMRAPKSYALAVRDSGGEILIKSARITAKKSAIAKIPVLRGIVMFFSSMVMGVKTLTKSAEVFGDDEDGTLDNGALYFTVALGLLFGIALFMLLPSLLGSLFSAAFGITDSLYKSLIESGLKLFIFISYLLIVARLKDIRRIYMYHGAEHKTINCFEKGMELTVQNVKSCSKRHDRCGTTFLFFIILVSIVVFSLSNILFEFLVNEYAFLDWVNAWYGRMIIRLLLLPLIAGLSYELLKFLAVLPDNAFVRILKAPGLALQALTTAEPNEPEIEVAIAAFSAARELDENPNAPERDWDTIPTDEALVILKEINAGRDESEAEWALSFALKQGISHIKAQQTIDRKAFFKARRIIKERAETGKPLQYIAKETKFWDYDIKVNPSVLIPRPETELLAEAAVNKANELSAKNILEIGTGSGAIAVALADKTKAHITATDISLKALKTAAQNTQKYTNISLVKSDVYEEIDGKFDLIVSNPPYIAESELPTLDPDVLKEPVIALNGGSDGLDILRKIIKDAPKHLVSGGYLLVEIGHNQSQEVIKLFIDSGLKNINIIKDYNGIDRIITGEKA